MTTKQKLDPSKFVRAKHGGLLWRGGRVPGSKALVSRAFEEFAKEMLADLVVQTRLRKRLLREIDGRGNAMPVLQVVAAAASREKASARKPTSIHFIAEIVNGRGTVQAVASVGEDEAEALALPESTEASPVLEIGPATTRDGEPGPGSGEPS